MKEHPILFSAPMVRALLDGRKTQTRRLASSPLRRVAASDHLWARETFAYVGSCDPGVLVWRADYPHCAKMQGLENIPDDIADAGYKWTPSIHMPRRASRLTMKATAVRFESLHDISDQDAIAEGIERVENGEWFHTPTGATLNPITAYRSLWDSLHGPGSFDTNPDVVCLEFRVIP